MKAFADDIAARREQRQREREHWQFQVDQQKRQNAMQDYMTSMALHSMGAMPVGPNDQKVEGALTDTLGPVTPGSRRETVAPPGGGQYYLPTATEAAKRSGKMKGISDAAYAEQYDPDKEVEIDLGPKYGNRKLNLPASKAADVLMKLNPHLQREQLGPNDAGDYTIIFRDPQTGQEQYRTTEKGAGKSARATAGQQKDYEAEVDADFHPQRERRIGEMMPWAYAQLGVDQTVASTDEAVKARKLAEEHVDSAIKEERSTRVAQARLAGTAGAAKPLTGKAIRRKNLAAAAKVKGMTPQQFEQQWTAGGGAITQ
jgi:hypothetical protein